MGSILKPESIRIFHDGIECKNSEALRNLADEIEKNAKFKVSAEPLAPPTSAREQINAKIQTPRLVLNARIDFVRFNGDCWIVRLSALIRNCHNGLEVGYFEFHPTAFTKGNKQVDVNFCDENGRDHGWITIRKTVNSNSDTIYQQWARVHPNASVLKLELICPQSGDPSSASIEALAPDMGQGI